MTALMQLALHTASAGPMVKGRAGWGPDYSSTRTIEALVARGFMTIEGRVDKWGAKALITEAGRTLLQTSDVQIDWVVGGPK